MVTNLPQLRRTPGDGTLIAGRDRHQGREEDPELHLIMSDSIKELGQYYFLSLLRFRIFTHKKSFRFVFLGRRFTERIYLLNFSGTALLTIMSSIENNLLLI